MFGGEPKLDCMGPRRSGAPPGFPYGDKVVFVANDWHAGLVPSYIAGKYRRAGVYKVRSSAPNSYSRGNSLTVAAQCMPERSGLHHQCTSDPAQQTETLCLTARMLPPDIA